MKVTADYHAHTFFSDGHNSVGQMVKAAEAKGLKELAITDHGYGVMLMHISRWRQRIQRDIILKLRDTTDMKILIGIEANLISYSGRADMFLKEFSQFDIVQFGFHRTLGPYATWNYPFVLRNFGIFPQNRDKNTAALIKAMNRYPLKVVSHPNTTMKVHPVEIAKEAKKLGILFELNEKHNHDIKPFINEVAATGVQFVLGSDGHSKKSVGEFPKTLLMLEEAGIPVSRVKGLEE